MTGSNVPQDNIVFLQDEGGNDVPFEFLDLIEFQGKEYVIFLPVEPEEDEEGMVQIFEIQDTDEPDTEMYVSVESEAVLYQVFEIFKEKFKDDFEFVD